MITLSVDIHDLKAEDVYWEDDEDIAEFIQDMVWDILDNDLCGLGQAFTFVETLTNRLLFITEYLESLHAKRSSS